MVSAPIKQLYEAFNERRLADAAALFAADAEIELIPGRVERGPEGYVRSAGAWVDAFPDAAIAVQGIHQRTDSICEVYIVITGTHRGVLDFGSYCFGPKGARAVLNARDLIDVRDGRIATSILTVDLNDLVNQLTVVDYDELIRRVDRISALREGLAHKGDPARRQEAAKKLGFELDAARRTLRPHYGK